MEGEVHLSEGMHAAVHDAICICSRCGHTMVKRGEVPCGMESCLSCGGSLMRL